MKIWTCLVVCSVGSLAHASFEMLLVTDRDSTQSPGSMCAVQRFDPVTGAYLGSFGRGFMDDLASGITLDTATGRAYISQYNSNTVQVWDYSTGLLLNEWACNVNPFQIARLANGNLLIGGGFSAAIYTPSGSFVSNLDSVGGGYGVATDGLNMLVATAGTIKSYNSAGVLQSTVSETTSYTLVTHGSRVFYGNSFGGLQLRSRVTTSLSAPTTVPVTALASSFYCLTAFGHTSTAYMAGALSGGQGAIARINTVSGTQSVFGTGLIHDARGMAIVVAPEPGSWAALGLGAIALMRRRRI